MIDNWSLPTLRLGRVVHVHDSLDSTNTHALALADNPANDGLVILARHQTAGRGQHGRIWLAPPGGSVLLSALLFPRAEIRRPVVLTAWAAVAVAEFVLQTTGEQANVKWPNDVHLQGKKICGILIEQRRQGEGPAAIVAGIGLNLAQPASFFEEAQLPLGGSLFSQTGVALDWEDAARRLIETLDREYSRLEEGEAAALESLWISRLGLLGETVIAEVGKRSLRGRLVDLGFDRAVLRTDGGLIELQPETIQHLRPDAVA